jgi:hypothetical protein
MASAEIAVPGFGRSVWPSMLPLFRRHMPSFAEDPSLVAPRSGPSLPSREDPSLVRTPLERTAPDTLTARAGGSLVNSAAFDTLAARAGRSIIEGAGSGPSSPRRERTPLIRGPCRTLVAGEDPFCYEVRAGYADIGDPPLVAAHRNLANVY